MWSSIKQIIKPDSLDETLAFLKNRGSFLFAGGSYLVADKRTDIHTLIDINHLLDDQIFIEKDDIHVHAGCTLQEMIEFNNASLSAAILASCPSKNIRNQRTIGGEVATARTNSDLMIYFYAAGTKLVINQSVDLVDLSNWDGQGIVTEIIIPKNNVKMERVALLDSAPAYVIIGHNEISDSIRVSIGGQISKVINHETRPEAGEQNILDFLDVVEAAFGDDHHGSAAYKRKLVSNLLQEMAGTR